MIFSRIPSPLITASASFISAVITSLLLHPLDVIKTRGQVSAISNGAVVSQLSINKSFSYIVKNEGYKGLYKGLQGQIIASGVSWFVFRYFYDLIRYNLDNYLYYSNFYIEKLNITSNSYRFVASPFSNSISTIFAGLLSTLIVHPLWLIKTRLEMESSDSIKKNWKYFGNGLNGWTNCVKEIYNNYGIRGLYSGIIPAIMLIPHSLIQMVIYDKLISLWALSSNFDTNVYNLLDPIIPFVWGFIAKLIAAILTYPLQVIRAREQMLLINSKKYEYFSLVKGKWSLIDIFVNHLYAGITVHIPKVCLHSGIMFLIYESILRILYRI